MKSLDAVRRELQVNYFANKILNNFNYFLPKTIINQVNQVQFHTKEKSTNATH